MRLETIISAVVMVACLARVHALHAQAPDPELAAAIARMPAVDNHSHVMRAVAPGERPDDEYDALPVDGLEPGDSPVRFRPDNPAYIGAWRALYGYTFADMDSAHVATLLAAKQKAMRAHGDGYPAWVLDRLGIRTMFANRVAMGRGLGRPRFEWVSYVDALMLPLSSDSARRKDSDSKFFYGSEAKLLKRYLADLGMTAPPPTISEYVARVITPTLERQKRDGVVALKFEAAYLRRLDLKPASADEAARIYSRYVVSGAPGRAEYEVLQNYLFTEIAREAGRLGLPIHLHTGNGAGVYFDLPGSNPAQMEPVLDDPSLRQTKFVMVHGGWPYYKETAALLGKPNVYADFSQQAVVLPPRQLADLIRTWLEFYPEKVLFGTDAFQLTPAVGWEETAWLATKSSREALALALTGMVRDGEISKPTALRYARMVLSGNADKLYGLKP
jgi:predicted TIM-barrel fold metal-dependent hydrolase